jgi:rhamnulokinase
LIKRYLAFDLGAESGRAMLGSLDDGLLTLEELHRFPNTPCACSIRCIGMRCGYFTR